MSNLNENLPELGVEIRTINAENIPVVSSLKIAEVFGKKHYHVLEDIRSIVANSPMNFTAPNFRGSSYTDASGKVVPMYLLTEDACMLLIMGYTGKDAMQIKVGYINRFNEMKAMLNQLQSKFAFPLSERIEAFEKLQAMLESGNVAGARSLNALILNTTGCDLVSIAEISIPSDTPDRTFVPPGTIATMIGGYNGQQVNIALWYMGMQTREDRSWRMTDLGAEYGKYFHHYNYHDDWHKNSGVRWDTWLAPEIKEALLLHAIEMSGMRSHSYGKRYSVSPDTTKETNNA